MGFTLWWTNIAIGHGPVEIVDFPMKNGDFPWQNVSSPEGNHQFVMLPYRGLPLKGFERPSGYDSQFAMERSTHF